LFEAPLPLIKFPHLGRVVPETNTETIRELFVHEYRLMYEIAATEIHVLAIIHGRRRFTTGLLDRDRGHG
jgi:plasmid stabilization system protein ParE